MSDSLEAPHSPTRTHHRETPPPGRSGRDTAGAPPGFDVLVHVVSHSDLLLRVNSDGQCSIGKLKQFIADRVCTQISQQLNIGSPAHGRDPSFDGEASTPESIRRDVFGSPLATADGGDPGEDRVAEVAGVEGSEPALTCIRAGADAPVSGFALGDASLSLPWSELDMRKEDELDLTSSNRVTGVHFPKASFVIPRWIEEGRTSGLAADAQRVLYLVSASRAAGETATSTVGISRLIALYVSVAYPEAGIRVVELASGDDVDLFIFEHNLSYVNAHLVPRVAGLRRELASHAFDTGKFDSEWPSRMQVTLSLCDGVPARVTAVTAALREFRPRTLQVYNVNTVRRRNQLRDKATQIFNFGFTHPATPVDELTSEDRLVVNEMREYAARFSDAHASGRSDLDTFWLRKSRKPVLAVLLVTDPGPVDPGPAAGPGTGGATTRSGTFGALAHHSPAAQSGSKLVASSSSGTLLRGGGEAPHHAAKRHGLDAIPALPTPSLSRRIVSEGGQAPSPRGVENPPDSPSTRNTRVFYGVNVEVSLPTGSLCAERNAISNALAALPNLHRRHFRRIAILGPSMGSSQPRLNLKPCGSCREWLKRIAAVNPDFSILTFESEDWDNQRVFVNSVATIGD